MPVGRLFVGVSDLEEAAFGEGGAKELQADRELWAGGVLLGEAAGEADAADAGEVGGDREDVGQVHREWVFRAFADLEGGDRRGRADQGVALLECRREILPDQRPHLLRAQVVGVVITGA